jgi:hypothetical protein
MWCTRLETLRLLYFYPESFNIMDPELTALLIEADELEDELDEAEEEAWWLASASIASRHGLSYCCAVPCRTAPYTGDTYVLELLKTRQPRRCQEVLRMPYQTFSNLVDFLKEHTSLERSRHVSLEEKLMIFLSIVGQPMGNRGVQEKYQYSGDTISKYKISYYN